MKTNRMFMCASLCALLFTASSCSSDSDSVESNLTADGKLIINASAGINSVGGGDSRVALDGVTPKWSENDQIAVKVDDNDAENLNLSTGYGTTSGKFIGTITPTSGATMYAYYPTTAVSSVNLTSQIGTIEDAANKNVMFASCAYGISPSFNFENKTSILKLDIPVPTGVTYDTSNGNGLYVKVVGAYSKGTLKTDGTWSNLSYDVIDVTGATIVEESGIKKISAYVVVIPGCKVNNIRIMVGGKESGRDTYKNFITTAYTSANTVAENKIITITKSLVVPTENYQSDNKDYTQSNYYKWDASDTYTNDGSYNSNNWSGQTIDFTKPDYGTNLWTKQCPTYQQISIMLGNGVNWVADQASGGKAYTLNGVTSTTYYSGLWLKKLVYCDITKQGTSVTPDATIDNPNNGQYFFLPAAGYYNSYGDLDYAGSYGYYWSGTPNDNSNYAYSLYFNSDDARVDGSYRGIGYLPWCAE